MSGASIHERVAQVVPELYALTPREGFPVRALAAVRRAVGGDKADYTEFDLDTRELRVVVDPQPPQLRDLAAARAAHMHEHPVLAHVVRRPGPAVRMISDYLTLREWHRLPLYGEFFARLCVEDQLTAVISPARSTRLAGVSIDRDRRSFSDADRRVMHCLQPHLTAARANAETYSRALAGTRPSPADAINALTARQREILAHIADGSTNSQIAFALDISDGTVRKHVEHILRRLGLTTRTAAAVHFATSSAVAAPAPAWTATVSPLPVV